MVKISFLFFLFLALFPNESDAQVFGGTPPSVKWQTIQTLPANIIYPPGLSKQAEEVAWLISNLNRTTLSTIGNKEKKVDIVFHNYTIIPNGYVQLAPFRSEFQLTPEQNSFDLGSLPWNQTLAIHEYRHVQQYNNFNVGLSKAFYILFGQDGLALANSLSVPDWFFEGDAVYQETLVSRQGRGRLPLFLTGFEALWVSGKNYSWMKLRNGSYRDYTPNHYPLGYMMVSYGREMYGKEIWAKTAVEAAAFKGLFYPLQKSIRRNTGISFDSFRLRAMNYFREQLNDSAYKDYASAFGKSQKHFAADQLFPQFTDSNQLIFLQSSYRLPPQFVRSSDNRQVSPVKFSAVSLDPYFAYRNHRIVYAAYEPDLRWGWKDFSVLRLLDLDSKKDIRLTDKTKYFSPDLSPDGQMIAAVNMEESGKCLIDVLQTSSGKRIRQLANPDNNIFTYPKFYTDSSIVVAARNKRGEMAILNISLSSGTEEIIIDWTMDPLGFLSVHNDDIFFTRTFDGNDQGFCWHEGKVYPMKTGAYAGNYQLSASYGKLSWTSFTSAGYRMQTDNIKTVFQTTPVQFLKNDTIEKHRIYSLDHPPFQIPAAFPDTTYAPVRYPALTHPFNFYSWRPYVNDPDFQLALLGQNVLNTFQSEIFVGYNRNEIYKSAGMDFTYGGLYPWINVGGEYLIDRNAYYNAQKIYWNELLAYTGLSVPLNFSRGRWITGLQGGSNLTYHKNYFQGTIKDSIRQTSYVSLDPWIFFSHQLQAGRMQIYPSFAQTISLNYHRAITNISGNQFLVSGNFFFPGISSTNSLVIRSSFQQRDSMNEIRFTNSFPFSRGYSGENFYQMYGFGINYNIPLVYPDWGFGQMIYLLRVRANAFFDYTGVPSFVTNGPGVQTQYRSAGIEIFLDTRWWNQLPISLGLRYSRLLDSDYEGRGPNQWELILPLNILDKGYSSRLSNR